MADGADLLAEKLYNMVMAARSKEEVLLEIAAELRKVAQGPRKWGVLR